MPDSDGQYRKNSSLNPKNCDIISAQPALYQYMLISAFPSESQVLNSRVYGTGMRELKIQPQRKNRTIRYKFSKEEKEMKISKDMLIGQLVTMDELIPPMLMRAGMHCLGCPSAQGESLEEACQVHGIDCDELVSQMNEILAVR